MPIWASGSPFAALNSFGQNVPEAMAALAEHNSWLAFLADPVAAIAPASPMGLAAVMGFELALILAFNGQNHDPSHVVGSLDSERYGIGPLDSHNIESISLPEASLESLKPVKPVSNRIVGDPRFGSYDLDGPVVRKVGYSYITGVGDAPYITSETPVVDYGAPQPLLPVRMCLKVVYGGFYDAQN